MTSTVLGELGSIPFYCTEQFLRKHATFIDYEHHCLTQICANWVFCVGGQLLVSIPCIDSKELMQYFTSNVVSSKLMQAATMAAAIKTILLYQQLNPWPKVYYPRTGPLTYWDKSWFGAFIIYINGVWAYSRQLSKEMLGIDMPNAYILLPSDMLSNLWHVAIRPMCRL